MPSTTCAAAELDAVIKTDIFSINRLCGGSHVRQPMPIVPDSHAPL
jgi:hypothetical protein